MDVYQRIKNLSVPQGKIDAVIDTDAYNEIDDQFAIAYLLKHGEKIRTRAIHAAPFLNARSESPKDGMEKSFAEIRKLLEKLDMPEKTAIVFKGSEGYLPDEKTPVASPAAENLVKLAREYSPESPLYVVAIGAITNVASALLLSPEIAENLVIVWLGGNALDMPQPAWEFNMRQDIAAARVVMGSGAPFVQLPCRGVVSAFTVSGPELEHWLLNKNKISDYLARNTITEAESYAKGKVWTRVIWDVTAVAWLLNDGDRFLSSRLIPAFLPEYDKQYSIPGGEFMRYVYLVNRDALLQDLFSTLLK